MAWPVSRILEYLLGPHSGIVYKRGELKELIAMHASGEGGHGGDLDKDTITIVGATLDLQTVRSPALFSQCFALNFRRYPSTESSFRCYDTDINSISVEYKFATRL